MKARSALDIGSREGGCSFLLLFSAFRNMVGCCIDPIDSREIVIRMQSIERAESR